MMSFSRRRVAPLDDVILRKESITEPLISGQNESENSTLTENSDNDEYNWNRDVYLVGFLVVTGIASSVAELILVRSIAVYLAGLICIANSIGMIARQRKLASESGASGFRKVFREEEDLRMQHELLLLSERDLKEESKQKKRAQQKLRMIAQRDGYSENEVIEMVYENKYLTKQTRYAMRLNFVMEIARIIIGSGSLNHNMEINKKALPLLILRLKIKLNAYGVELNKEDFEEVVAANNSISAALRYCRDILFLEYENCEDQKNRLNALKTQSRIGKSGSDQPAAPTYALSSKTAKILQNASTRHLLGKTSNEELQPTRRRSSGLDASSQRSSRSRESSLQRSSQSRGSSAQRGTSRGSSAQPRRRDPSADSSINSAKSMPTRNRLSQGNQKQQRRKSEKPKGTKEEDRPDWNRQFSF